MNRFKENNPDDVAFEQEVIDRHKTLQPAKPILSIRCNGWVSLPPSAFALRATVDKSLHPSCAPIGIYLAKRQPSGVAVSTSGQTSSRPVP
jgi:hypothetical protein